MRDLFAGVSNAHWDLGRILSAIAVLTMVAGAGWNMFQGQPLDLMSAGTGIAAVLTSAAALIGVKDFVRARSPEVGSSE